MVEWVKNGVELSKTTETTNGQEEKTGGIMIEIFIDAPMELQVLLLGGLIMIIWSMFKE